jgi:hypothetical protein
VNSRLAQLGIVAGAFGELQGRGSLVAQALEFPGPVAALIAVIAAASFIPALKGLKPEPIGFGPFSPKAELVNGRAAMLAFVISLALEAHFGLTLL